MSDEQDKPTLTRKPLGLKRTVEAGQVQQQFSHGRRNTVVVEVKRRRVLGRPGEAARRTGGRRRRGRARARRRARSGAGSRSARAEARERDASMSRQERQACCARPKPPDRR